MPEITQPQKAKNLQDELLLDIVTFSNQPAAMRVPDMQPNI